MHTKRNSESFFTAIDDLVGVDVHGRVWEITPPDTQAPVFVAIYDDVPEGGHTTSFTFGLSSVSHAAWTFGRPELVISVNSMDSSWGRCMGDIVASYRGRISFEYGQVVRFGERVVDDCPMTSFLVFANQFEGMNRPIKLNDRTINIVQLYPIYDEEASLIKEIGAEKFFFELGIDFNDLKRAPGGAGRADA